MAWLLAEMTKAQFGYMICPNSHKNPPSLKINPKLLPRPAWCGPSSRMIIWRIPGRFPWTGMISLLTNWPYLTTVTLSSLLLLITWFAFGKMSRKRPLRTNKLIEEQVPILLELIPNFFCEEDVVFIEDKKKKIYLLLLIMLIRSIYMVYALMCKKY